MDSELETAVAELRGSLEALAKCVDRGRYLTTCSTARALCGVADQLINEALKNVESLSEAFDLPLLPPREPLRPNLARTVRASVMAGDWNVSNYF